MNRTIYVLTITTGVDDCKHKGRCAVSENFYANSHDAITERLNKYLADYVYNFYDVCGSFISDISEESEEFCNIYGYSFHDATPRLQYPRRSKRATDLSIIMYDRYVMGDYIPYHWTYVINEIDVEEILYG